MTDKDIQSSGVQYSIVVVTWECADHLETLVRSMNRHLDCQPQLVVVDNASSDDPRWQVEQWRGETTFIQLGRNEGFGRANNVGVQAAKHEAVVLVNPDTRLVDRSLTALAREALILGALVGPRLLNTDGSIQPSASGSPVGVWPWVNAFVPGAVMPDWMKARTEPWRLERQTRVAWLTGACIAAPRSLLIQLGPFDPRIELYSEDLELGLRAGRSGIPSYFCPSVARMVHAANVSASRRFSDAGLALAARNRRIVLRRAYGVRSEHMASWAERLKLEVRFIVKRALHRPSRHDWAALMALRRDEDIGA